ncbi:uncharacterized protein [Halyomorpha halys]|uniref:uncharacterized protein isoform X4 n=1 Tax=Halyomorpha halys TaxID=286706 RepID=UPI0006D51E08|nr:uncharacterized protein LOC106677777 isoform X2 [Halyomorpha halys]
MSCDLNRFSREILEEFIRAYQNLPCLWRTKSPEYHDKAKREAAYDVLLSTYRIIDGSADKDAVVKKINALRTNYRREKKKVEASRYLGDKIYEPTLWYYHLFDFLEDQVTSRSSSPNLNEREPPSQQETWTPPIIEQPTPPPLKKLKQSPKDTAEELLGLATEYLNKPESEWEVMAKGWALKLSKLATDQRLFAEKIINDTLFEAQMGTLTRNGVRFLTASDSDSCRSSSKNEKFL